MWVASMRASRSAEPPAPNGTTMVTCRCGHSCAGAGAARQSRNAAIALRLARMLGPPGNDGHTRLAWRPGRFNTGGRAVARVAGSNGDVAMICNKMVACRRDLGYD